MVANLETIKKELEKDQKFIANWGEHSLPEVLISGPMEEMEPQGPTAGHLREARARIKKNRTKILKFFGLKD